MSALGSLVVKLALEYAEFTKGLDKSSQESLKFAKNAQVSMDKASAAVNGFIGKVVGIGAAYLSVSFALNAFNSSINDMAALDDMSQKTGASVENLSKLQKVAKSFGGDFSLVDTSITKLARGIAGLDDPSNKANAALTALGISSRDSNGKLRDAAEITIEVAKKLQDYKDGASKAALATDLFGKSGAEVLPYLNDLAENVDKYTGISKEAAAKSAAFQDQLTGLKQNFNELIETVTIGMLPALSKFIDNLNTIARFKSIFSSIGGIEEKDYVKEIENREKSLAKVIESRNNLSKPTLKNKINDFVFGDVRDLNTQIAIYKDEIAALNVAKAAADIKKSSASPYTNPQSDKKDLNYNSGQASKDAASADSARKKADSEAEAARKKAEDQYKQLTNSINEKISATEHENELGRSLTEAEKVLIKVTQDRNDGIIKLTDSQYEYVKAQLKKLEADELDNQILKQLNASESERTQLQDAQTESIIKQAYELEQQNTNYGKLPSAITDVTIARLNDKKAMLEGLGLVVPEIDAQIAALERLRAAQTGNETLDRIKKFEDERVRAFDDAQKKIDEESKRMWEIIESTAHDTWNKVWLGGNDAFKNIGKTIKSAILDLLYQMTIKKWILNIGIISTVGTSSIANASTNTDGSGIFGSIKDIISSGNGSIVSSIENLGAFLSTGNGGLGDTIGGFLGQYSSQIADGFSYLGAGLQLAQGNFAGAALTAVGTYFGGPIGGAIGGAIGSALGGAFGFGKKKPPRYDDSYSGTYANGIFSGYGYVPNNKTMGAQGTLGNLSAAFSSSLGTLLSVFGLSDAIKTSSTIIQGRATSQAGFSARFDGGSYGYSQGKIKQSAQTSLNNMIEEVLGKGLVSAIQKSKLAEGIKGLFVGITDKAKVSEAISSLLTMKNALLDLPKVFDAVRNVLVDTKQSVNIDQLKKRFDSTATYADLFYSEQEKQATFKASLERQFASLNTALPDTRDGFRKLVDGLDVTTESGLFLFDVFTQMAPTMDKYYKGMQSQIDVMNQAAEAVKPLENAFANVVDFNRYNRVAANNGAAFADAYTSILPQFNANPTGATNEEMIALLNKMIIEIQAGNVAIATNTLQTSQTLRRWNGDGMPETRVVA